MAVQHGRGSGGLPLRVHAPCMPLLGQTLILKGQALGQLNGTNGAKVTGFDARRDIATITFWLVTLEYREECAR